MNVVIVHPTHLLRVDLQVITSPKKHQKQQQSRASERSSGIDPLCMAEAEEKGDGNQADERSIWERVGATLLAAFSGLAIAFIGTKLLPKRQREPTVTLEIERGDTLGVLSCLSSSLFLLDQSPPSSALNLTYDDTSACDGSVQAASSPNTLVIIQPIISAWCSR